MKKIIWIIVVFMALSYPCEASLFAKGKKTEKNDISGDTGRIEAVIRDLSGNLMPGSKLYIYLNNNADFRGLADYISDKADGNGKAGIDLKPGKYYVIARKRAKEEDVGPLKEGDYNGRFDKNPVEVKGKKILKIEVVMEKIEGKMLLSPLSPNTSISIEGVLKDEKGDPVKNGYAMVYHSKGINGRPDYMSRPSDNKGRFRVYISETGSYFIIGRMKYGGPPKPEELYGEYDKKEIELKANDKIKDIEIILKPFGLDLDTLNK
ncbi:MAG: hypothetical protein PHX78_08755 [bacterium]|nr:hypothetical protein [bacterium]